MHFLGGDKSDRKWDVYCKTIIDKYIEKEYTANGKHLVLNNKEQAEVIRKKLRRILNAERLNPNRFEQKISFIKEKITEELRIASK